MKRRRKKRLNLSFKLIWVSEFSSRLWGHPAGKSRQNKRMTWKNCSNKTIRIINTSKSTTSRTNYLSRTRPRSKRRHTLIFQRCSASSQSVARLIQSHTTASTASHRQSVRQISWRSTSPVPSSQLSSNAIMCLTILRTSAATSIHFRIACPSSRLKTLTLNN